MVDLDYNKFYEEVNNKKLTNITKRELCALLKVEINLRKLHVAELERDLILTEIQVSAEGRE